MKRGGKNNKDKKGEISTWCVLVHYRFLSPTTLLGRLPSNWAPFRCPLGSVAFSGRGPRCSGPCRPRTTGVSRREEEKRKVPRFTRAGGRLGFVFLALGVRLFSLVSLSYAPFISATGCTSGCMGRSAAPAHSMRRQKGTQPPHSWD